MNSHLGEADISGERDPELQRYGWALSRHWWVIAATAAAAALVGFLLVGSTSYTLTARIEIPAGTEVLSSSGLASAFDGTPPLYAARDFLNDSARRETLEDNTTLSGEIDPTTGLGLVLTVTADDEARAKALSATILDELSTWIGERRKAATADLVDVVDYQRSQTKSRLAELDAQIGALEGTSALRDAYLDERTLLTTTLLSLDAQTRALTTFGSAPQRLAVVEGTSTESNSRVLWFVVAGVLGGLLASTAILLAAHFDRRIRSRADLRRAIDAEALPLVPSTGTERSASMRATVAAALRSAGGRPIGVLAVDRHSLPFAESFAAELGHEAQAMLATGDTTPQADSVILLVASAGRTHQDDLSRVCLYATALGCTVIGTVLGDVKATQLRRASV